jgi:hypothetical protein
MSKKAEVGQLQKMSEIETEIKVNMDDVVSVFTSKYEEDLYDTKARLTAEIAEGRKVVAKLQKDIVDAIDPSKFIVKNPLFNVEVGSKSLIEDKGVVEVCFTAVAITPNGGNRRDSYGAQTTRDMPVTKKALKELATAKSKLNAFADELNTTMVAIRDISRKERQIRARIIEQNLENSGMESLLKDKGLQKLIALK